MKVKNRLAPGALRLGKHIGDISKEAYNRLKWFDYYSKEAYNRLKWFDYYERAGWNHD